jgi:hypothetical protein
MPSGFDNQGANSARANANKTSCWAGDDRFRRHSRASDPPSTLEEVMQFEAGQFESDLKSDLTARSRRFPSAATHLFQTDRNLTEAVDDVAMQNLPQLIFTLRRQPRARAYSGRRCAPKETPLS